jgi:hypothetical protein
LLVGRFMKRFIILVFASFAVGCDDHTSTIELDLCDPSLCAGAPPDTAVYECPDGESVAGPACIATGATCTWGVLDCAPHPRVCPIEACGPAPGIPNYQCPDGSIAGPACHAGPDDTCTWLILECEGPHVCPTDACPDPAPAAPNYVCADGTTIAGPACMPGPDDACAWQLVECP